ncbi:MAG: DUF1573 domain-containing protein [Muribaculaceae bacterium]|nr:DUF1573 domain-containing protein [Muribaculaceae bacterium]
MKTLKTTSILTTALLIVMLLGAFPALAKDNAKISFNEAVYDFGQISLKKGKVSHEFTFTNTGEKNLVITDARADCGCTRPEYSDAPIAPGKTGTVKVTLAPAAKGHFTKKVTITTNGSPRKTRLLIKGEVVE